jgi:transposase-like protein
MTKRSPFKYFKTSPEIIRMAVMMYVRFPLSLRNVEGFVATFSLGRKIALITSVYAASSAN